MEPFDIATNVVGWASMSISTIRYYPQLYRNWKHKSVIGLDLSYVVFDITSSMLSLLFYYSLFYSPTIAKQYQDRFHRSHLPASYRELIFSSHTLVLSVIQVIHIIIYQRGKQKVQWYCFVITAVAWLSIFGMFMLQESCVGDDCWLTFYMYFAVVIVAIDVVRYFPQAWLNRSRQRTDGFSSGFIWCSFIGALLWLLHFGMIAGSDHNMNEFTSNVATLVIVGVTLLVDTIFIIQSTCWYPADPSYSRVFDGDTYSTLESSDSSSIIGSDASISGNHAAPSYRVSLTNPLPSLRDKRGNGRIVNGNGNETRLTSVVT